MSKPANGTISFFDGVQLVVVSNSTDSLKTDGLHSW